jgi:hypothetical protein
MLVKNKHDADAVATPKIPKNLNPTLTPTNNSIQPTRLLRIVNMPPFNIEFIWPNIIPTEFEIIVVPKINPIKMNSLRSLLNTNWQIGTNKSKNIQYNIKLKNKNPNKVLTEILLKSSNDLDLAILII